MRDDNTKSFIRFCVVGVGNTLIDLGIFTVLFYGFHVTAVPAHVAGFVIAVLNSYLMNKFWTFGDKTPHNPGQIAKFLTVCGVGLLASTLVVHFCEPLMPAIIAKIGAIGVTVIINYSGNRFLVFGQGEARR